MKDFVRRTTFIVVERPETKFWRCVLAEIRKRRRRILLDCDLTAGAKPRLAYPYAPCDDSKCDCADGYFEHSVKAKFVHDYLIILESNASPLGTWLHRPTEIKRKALDPVN